MYLAYPAADDEQLAEDLCVLKAQLAEAVRRAPERYRAKRRTVRPERRRRESDDPLRLAGVRKARAAAQYKRKQPPAAAVLPERDPEEGLREAVRAARRRGISMEMIADSVGVSEKTLRRHLRAPDMIPLGEYRKIMALGAAGGV